MKSNLDAVSANGQIGLFLASDIEGVACGPRRAVSSRRVLHALADQPPHGISLQTMAEALDACDDCRVLRRLKPRSLVPIVLPLPVGTEIGIIVDTQTTGLNHTRDEVIELGMVAFTYADGVIGDVVGVFSALREPTVEISAEITRITGITPEMVAGHRIDLDDVPAFRVSSLPDARTVIDTLPIWFEHYNTVHPHKALGYLSPREFIASRKSL